MPERINKLQPDRTLYLRGFDSFAAAASIHSASPSGFTISGTFRDPGDFAVAVLYDADNYFEHPSIKYLPDFNFSGLTLNFDLTYTDGAQPIDSPEYNWIAWATLDCVRSDQSTAHIPLFSNAMLGGNSFPAASATINVVTSGAGVQAFDRVTLCYQNLAFDYIVPGSSSAAFSFFAGGAGTQHSITVNGRVYTFTESAGQTSADVAAGLAQAVNSPGDPQVTAAAASNNVTLTVNLAAAGIAIPVSASGGAPATLFLATPAYVASQLAAEINLTNWTNAGPPYALLAAASGAQITLTAARYGAVNVSGASVTLASGAVFSGILPGAPILIGNAFYTVASVQSPAQLTLTANGPQASGIAYVAPRGGRDGNLIQLYALSKTATLVTDLPLYSLAGGSSAVTWNINIDFTALGISSLRQCWLTFAPSLANGAAYTATEWQAVFSNWTLTGDPGVMQLQVAGPGSVRIEESDAACKLSGSWTLSDNTEAFYSGYFAMATKDPNATATITYTCQFQHELFCGTSLYSDRGVMFVQVDGDAPTTLDCRLNVSSALVTRRLMRPSVAAGTHTVKIWFQTPGVFYLDFIEAAVPSDVPDALTSRTGISPALDFDTDHSYKLSPARIWWMMDKLGYGGPINEYLGVFWWNERVLAGATFPSAVVTVGGAWAGGDTAQLTVNGTTLLKNVLPKDTPATIAQHFASYINGAFLATWASVSVSGGAAALTITSRSTGASYAITVAASATSPAGTIAVTQQPAAPVAGNWVIDDTVTPPVNRATRDWHADFYTLAAARKREVVTACSLELVNPPAGYAALFPDAQRTPVSTATGFANLVSTQCAVGGSKMLAYQKAVYREIASLQSAAGLTPALQYGEFLWWYFAGANGGMAYYDDETLAAAQTALGRPLYVFQTPNDDPTVNSGADAVFVRNRLRDHVAALVADIRSAYATVICEVLWPYDVNYPMPVGSPPLGGQLNRFVNLPVEWQTQSASGLDRIKEEALAFGTVLRNLDYAQQAISLFLNFGWPQSAVRYLAPVYGSAVPWYTELNLAIGAGLNINNLWAFDHVCLFNLQVPEPAPSSRSTVQN